MIPTTVDDRWIFHSSKATFIRTELNPKFLLVFLTFEDNLPPETRLTAIH